MASTLGLYVTRWQRWAVAGLQGITIDIYGKLTGILINHHYPMVGIAVNRNIKPWRKKSTASR
jgi:hypothetical protein